MALPTTYHEERIGEHTVFIDYQQNMWYAVVFGTGRGAVTHIAETREEVLAWARAIALTGAV